MRFTTPLCLALLAAGVAAAPPAAEGSLTYPKHATVFAPPPDAPAAKQLPPDGGYEPPPRADDGPAVAARQPQETGRTPRRLPRMDRDGQLLNPPVVTVPV